MILTIDGSAGTGKTTVARKVAERLGLPYFDTGAMYRSVAWAILDQGISLEDTEAISNLLDKFTFDIREHDGETHYFVGEREVTGEIRTQKINEIVSQVAAMPKVREVLWVIQRTYGHKTNAVFEGRDMGSVVFPNAEVKIFLKASPKMRAERRLKEMQAKLPEEAKAFDPEKMKKELKRRDSLDKGRKLAPLKCPKGAFKVDTSSLTIEEVVDKIVDYYHTRSEKLLPGFLHCRNMRPIYRFVIFTAWLYFKLLHRHKVYGIEHSMKRAAIIAPNHTSYYDPPLVSSSWPEEVHFLGRVTLFRNPIFGWFIRKLNTHPVHGGVADVSVFKTILKLLSEEKQVVLFPEGERTDGKLGEIKPGIGMLLMKSKAAIIPTYVDGAYEAFPRDKKWPKLFGKTSCVFGSPILSESFAHLEKKEAQLAIAAKLTASLKELKAWFEAGAEGIPP